MTHLEERIAHLTRAMDDMSDVVVRQQNEIDTLTRRVQMLMVREGEREAAQGNGADGGMIADDNQPPPHW